MTCRFGQQYYLLGSLGESAVETLHDSDVIE